MSSPKRILILRALNLGDFLTGIPAFRAIRRAYPESRITLAAPRLYEPFLALLDHAIDDIAHSHELAALPQSAYGADLGIDLHGKGPESHRLLLAAGVRRLIAFRHAEIPESAGCAVHDPEEHEVARWCRLLQTAGIPADADDLLLRPPALEFADMVRGATLVHPGAASVSRRWPIERWIEVIRSEQARGRAVVITGGRAAHPRAPPRAPATGLPAERVFAGRTTLMELAAIVAAAGRVVCGDTGIAHLASAYSKPSVLLFGPTSPKTWGPPAKPYHRVLWNGTTGDPHASEIDAGLEAISVDDVVRALEALPHGFDAAA
jgi:ADP-heptose:LPS heptosyltransferase